MTLRAIAIFGALGAAGLATVACAEDFLTIGVGRVQVVHSKESIITVAVGDPAIADVAIEGDRSVMVFGKKSGATDLVLMNGAHRAIMTNHILVVPMAGNEGIIVRRPGTAGMTTEAWYCAPACQKVEGGEK